MPENAKTVVNEVPDIEVVEESMLPKLHIFDGWKLKVTDLWEEKGHDCCTLCQ